MAKRGPPKPPSPWTMKPYRVGKGKPPVEHQFKLGQKPPKGSGRPKGSKSRDDMEKLLDEKVELGTDRLGRPIWRKLRDVVDRQLVNQAAKGDLAAIKILNEYRLRLEAIRQRNVPDAETLLREREEQIEREKIAERIGKTLVETMDILAQLKKAGAVKIVEGRPVILPWVREEAKKRTQAGLGSAHPD